MAASVLQLICPTWNIQGRWLTEYGALVEAKEENEIFQTKTAKRPLHPTQIPQDCPEIELYAVVSRYVTPRAIFIYTTTRHFPCKVFIHVPIPLYWSNYTPSKHSLTCVKYLHFCIIKHAVGSSQYMKRINNHEKQLSGEVKELSGQVKAVK